MRMTPKDSHVISADLFYPDVSYLITFKAIIFGKWKGIIVYCESISTQQIILSSNKSLEELEINLEDEKSS